MQFDLLFEPQHIKSDEEGPDRLRLIITYSLIISEDKYSTNETAKLQTFSLDQSDHYMTKIHMEKYFTVKSTDDCSYRLRL